MLLKLLGPERKAFRAVVGLSEAENGPTFGYTFYVYQAMSILADKYLFV